MNPLQQIEQTYGFQYPKLYHQLYEDGMLNWGQFGPRWRELEYPKIKDNPPLLLEGRMDFEILELSEISEEIEFLHGAESFYNIKPEYLFIPFGKNGAGDYYCLFYNKENPLPEPWVVLFAHDFNEAEVLADNFQNFIFYGLLECVLYMDELLPDDDAFYTEIANMLRTHLPYLSEEQAKIVEDIYKRKTFASTYTYTFKDRERTEKYIGLLSREEFDTLCSKFISIPKEEKQFEYSDV